MSAVHLDARGVPLCDNGGKNLSGLQGTNCTRCLNRLAKMRTAEAEAATERRFLAKQEAACRATGLGAAWDSVVGADNPSGRMLRNMIGTVALYAVEVADERRLKAVS